MVQVSLRKVGCMAGPLALLLLAAAFLAMFTDVGRHEHAENVRRRPDPLDVEDLRRLSPPEHTVALVPAQKAELEGIYADIVLAYSNGQVEVLREWRRKLPERVELIRLNDFDDISQPLFRLVYDESLAKLNKSLGKESIGEVYGNVSEFERHVDTLITLVLLYGDVELHRRSLGGLFKDIEAFIYYRLKFYRDGFRAEGRADLECAAERAISVWMDQIESENGYTRACLVKSIAHFRVWCDKLMEQDGRTWEEISQSQVRGATHTLALFGYTPKWLDEFKNIPRHATPNAKQPVK